MELEFLDWLRQRFGQLPRIEQAVGDDAAVISKLPAHPRIVVTTDMLIEDVHFRRFDASAERIGRKALAANLSDLAAMAAEPLAAFVALSLPRGSDAGELARGILTGMMPLALEYRCPVAGGDTNVADGPLTIAVTVLGTATPRGPLLRSGARPGDRMLVTGSLGGSLRGRHYDFEPRVREALLLNDNYTIHAGMDLSDGLALDLRRMCERSDVGAVVELSQIPISSDAQHAALDDPSRTPLQRALGDGEDFELLLAAPPEVAAHLLEDAPLACGLTDIGFFTEETRLLHRTASGEMAPLAATGFEHE